MRKLLLPLVHDLVIVQARDGKDFSDHIDAGHGPEDFDPVGQLGYADIDIPNLLELPWGSPEAEADQERLTDPATARLLAVGGACTPRLDSTSSAATAQLSSALSLSPSSQTARGDRDVEP